MRFLFFVSASLLLKSYLENLCCHYLPAQSTYHWFKGSGLLWLRRLHTLLITSYTYYTNRGLFFTFVSAIRLLNKPLHLLLSCSIYFILPSLDIMFLYLWITGLIYLLAIIDWSHGILPDFVVYLFLLSGFLLSPVYLMTSEKQLLFGTIVGFLSLYIIDFIYQLLFGTTGIGRGDMKFLAAIGAWLGWQSLNLVLLMASLCGLLYVALGRDYYTSSPWGSRLPFGPFLAWSCWVICIIKILFPNNPLYFFNISVYFNNNFFKTTLN